MGFIDWMKRRGQVTPKEGVLQESPAPGGDGTPVRFSEPSAHLEYLMSPEEQKAVDAVEARFRAPYIAVFDAVDQVHKSLDARKDAPSEEWKRLEADVEGAVAGMRKAFGNQRQFVEREMGLIARLQKEDQSALPAKGKRAPEWDR